MYSSDKSPFATCKILILANQYKLVLTDFRKLHYINCEYIINQWKSSVWPCKGYITFFFYSFEVNAILYRKTLRIIARQCNDTFQCNKKAHRPRDEILSAEQRPSNLSTIDPRLRTPFAFHLCSCAKIFFPLKKKRIWRKKEHPSDRWRVQFAISQRQMSHGFAGRPS